MLIQFNNLDSNEISIGEILMPGFVVSGLGPQKNVFSNGPGNHALMMGSTMQTNKRFRMQLRLSAHSWCTPQQISTRCSNRAIFPNSAVLMQWQSLLLMPPGSPHAPCPSSPLPLMLSCPSCSHAGGSQQSSGSLSMPFCLHLGFPLWNVVG